MTLEITGREPDGGGKISRTTIQIIRDWVVKFNADGPDGLIDRKASGQSPRLNDVHCAALDATIESGPIPAVMGSCDGGSSISANGSLRNLASSSPGRP